METETLKNILYNEVINTQGWLTKGQLYLVAENNGYSPETGARRLRELENEGKIQVSYYKGKRHQTLARYARIGEDKPLPPKPKIEIRMFEGRPLAVLL